MESFSPFTTLPGFISIGRMQKCSHILEFINGFFCLHFVIVPMFGVYTGGSPCSEIFQENGQRFRDGV